MYQAQREGGEQVDAELLLGLIGHPIGHSRSPAMQQAALDALGIPARYVLWETPPGALTDRITSLRSPRILGANVTIPHKAAVLPLLDALAPEVEREMHAVNSIVRENTPQGVRLIGHNTDVVGILRVLEAHATWPATQRLLLLGAGGAARAAVAAARRLGARITVAARNVAAAQTLGAPVIPWEREALAAALADADALVHATPIGTGTDGTTPLPPELLAHLPAHAFVFDMVYAPPETALVRAARQRGLRAEGGLEMLLYQGAAAFTLWTGRDAPLDVMAAALGIGNRDGIG